MDQFNIPIILKPEVRKSIQAGLVGDICIIKYPQLWQNRRKYLIPMVDRTYWCLLAKLHQAQLRTEAQKLNQLFFRFEYRDIRYHRQFRRWGSCSTLKNINLSHRLIGAPQHLADYVIIHELAHLKHLNHGKEFWSLVKMTGVNPKTIRSEIETYGRSWQNFYYQWYQKLLKSV